MSEDPQFRTVLRGFDPDQVRSTLDEMQKALTTARRIAADRTIELTRMQDKHAQLERDLDEAVHRIADLESRAGHSNASADVGSRIGSILALANEEAEELRAGGRQQAQRDMEEAAAAIAASRAELERYADGVRANANSQAGQIIDDARRTAGEILGHARHEAEQRRAEAQAIVDSHRAQADAVAELGRELSMHSERLQLAMARVGDLAEEEAALVERQAEESAERVRRDKETQLAAVDARRESITSQLTTVGGLLRELGAAVDPGAHGEVGPGTAETNEARADAEPPAAPEVPDDEARESSLEASHESSHDGWGPGEAEEDGVSDIDELTEPTRVQPVGNGDARTSDDTSRHEQAGARR